MDISLPSELEQFIERKVNTGQYRSAAEVISSALENLRYQETVTDDDLDELRKLVRVGIEQSRSGQSTELDMQQIRSKVRARLGSRTG